MAIKNTKAWKMAEWEYEETYALQMVPLFGKPLSQAEMIRRFENIIKECPKFYPALLESGFHRLKTGDNILGEQQIEEGFQLLLELAEPKHLYEEIDALIENFEKLWRFDLSRRYLEILVDRYPSKASFHDDLAHAAVRMGDIDMALLHINKAVEIEPENVHFRSNHGWIHLFAGNLTEAGEDLKKALNLDPADKVVKGNLEVFRYLTKHGGNYLDYLLRPLDREKIDRLGNEEKWEQVDKLCASYNSSRMEAMAQTLLREDEQKRLYLADLLHTLKRFFQFVEGICQDIYVYEDILLLHENFKPIMHKFILKFSDVDRKVISDIYKYLFEYYGFLASKDLVSNEEFRCFKKDITSMKKELIDKMKEYNAVRHNPNITDEEKEEIREELFEGDHAWPHL